MHNECNDCPCQDDEAVPASDAEQVGEALEALTKVLDTEFARSLVTLGRDAIRRRIELDAKASERHEKVLAAQLKVANRWSWVFGLCVLLSFGFLTAVIWLLKDTPDALLPVVTALVGLIAGTGGGWVFGHKAAKIQE